MLTEPQEQAAKLLAAGKLNRTQIAEALGIGRRTLHTWIILPELRAEIKRLASAWRTEVRTLGIADQDRRLFHLNERHAELRRLIAERGADPQMQEVPGGTTGMLAVSYKKEEVLEDAGDGKMVLIKKRLPEYRVDTAMLAELRALEQQIAVEKGEYKAKSESTVNVRFSSEDIALAEAMKGIFTIDQLFQMEAALEAKALLPPHNGD